MKNMKIFTVVCVVFFSLLNVNKSDGKETKLPSFKPINIVVILDTSNRVSKKKHLGQVERDIEIVEDIVTQFEKIVKAHLSDSELIQYPHRLTLVVPEQPKVPSIPDKVIGHFTIKDSGKGRSWPEFQEQKKALLPAIPKLYEFVEQHKQTGSDIWEWFKYEAEDYLLADQLNLIICLSDGYLNFDKSIEVKRRKGTFMQIGKLRDDPNWKQEIHGSEGLLSTGKDFNRYNVKFLMVEINLQSEKGSGIPYQQDFEIIKEYWKIWLNTMGIKDTDFIKQGRPLKKKIESFISPENRR